MPSLWHTIVDLLFPAHCVGCAQEGGWLCESCFRGIRLEERPACPVCRRPSLRGRVHNGRCARKSALGALVVAARYAGNPVLDRAIAQLKYRNGRELAPLLGSLLSDAIGRQVGTRVPIALVPIPLHPARQRWRGFNQAELLCQSVGRATGFPVIKLLKRIRHTQQQARLSRAERLSNVVDAFALVPDSGPIPERILLLDDVATTGATLQQAAGVLRSAGCREVIGAVLARG